MIDATTIKDALACGKSRCTCRTNGNTHCPAHADDTPSLSVKAGDKVPVIVSCHGGCPQEAVIVALKELGLWPEGGDTSTKTRGLGKGKQKVAGAAWRVVREWPYPNNGSAPIAIHGREENGALGADGKPNKRNRWRVPEGTYAQGLRGLKLSELPLYNAHVCGEYPDSAAVLVEGEKAADCAREHGLLAVSLPGGAAQRDFGTALDPLKDRAVWLWPDAKDEASAELMAAVRKVLPHADYVRVPDDMPAKGDAVEYFALGHTIAELLIAPEAQPLAELLDRVEGFLGRFVAYPDEHARTAHTLWIAHTHPMGAWDSTPRIAFLSPEPGSGKTRAIEVTELLVPRPVEAINVTPAYLFRKVGDPAGLPTILYDEIDTVFGPKAKDNEEIRGLLNAGHRRGAVAGRCVVKGKIVETEEIPAFCAVALAGLGGLPDTLLSRSVVIRMKRRASDERIEPFRRRLHEADGHALRDALATWAAASEDALARSWPTLPVSVVDRNADVWEALIAIADLAGGEWPDRARCSAVALVAASIAGTPSLGVRLLSDLRAVFGDRDSLPTSEILAALHKIDDAPWGRCPASWAESR